LLLFFNSAGVSTDVEEEMTRRPPFDDVCGDGRFVDIELWALSPIFPTTPESVSS
jgi:hypothetical protein